MLTSEEVNERFRHLIAFDHITPSVSKNKIFKISTNSSKPMMDGWNLTQARVQYKKFYF